ncbi:MAG: hypothetical protein ACOYKE_00995 [Ferruginibacter sp.]
MKWILVNSKSAAIQEYHLLNNDSCGLIVKYNPTQHSVRLLTADYQRLFYIENTGSLNGKYIFRNEYGIELGYIGYDKWFGNNGLVVLENKKFQYRINNLPEAKITFLHTGTGEEIASCLIADKFPPEDIQHRDLSYLILALCWQLIQPTAIAVNTIESAKK